MNALKQYPINLTEILKADMVIKKYLKETPLTYYRSLSEATGADVYIKHENHNPGGSFKIRGGLNLLHHVKAHGIRGVITFSTGNHGLSIARASELSGIEATVVVPEHANKKKINLIRQAGARLIEKGKTFEETSQIVAEIAEKEQLYFVHPANEPHLINGVATEFLEICKRLPEIDVLFVPIGAGSEAAAAVTLFKALKPEVRIIAVQAEQSQAAYLSWKKGAIMESSNATFAGGFATGIGYELPFSIYKNNLDDFVLLSEEEIRQGMLEAITQTSNLAEGAGASTLMALRKMAGKVKGKHVVLQMSGANVEFEALSEIVGSSVE